MTFRTDNRASVCDLVLPPEGYRTACAIGTTYSLDFVALTAVVAALGNGAVREEGESSGPEIVRAVLGLKQQIVVFVNQCSIHPGRVANARRLYNLYDRFVVPVPMPHGAFHPKLWLVKYVPLRGRALEPRYRLLCSSRNITTANTWECGVVFDGRTGKRGGSVGASVGRFIRAAMPYVRDGSHGAARQLVREVEGVRFEVARPGVSATFAGQQPGGRSLWHQLGPEKEEETLLLAPFVSAGFLEAMRNRCESFRVISRQEELDLIASGRDSANGLATWLRTEGNAFVVVPGAPEADKQMSLHAKVLFTRNGKRGRTVVGSANGTAAAWGTKTEKDTRNWEAVACLDGPELLSDFERHFMYEDTRRRELRGWVAPYRPGRVKEDTRAEKDLEGVQQTLSAMELHVRWDARRRVLVLRCLNSEPLREAAERAHIRVAPYGLENPEGRLVDAAPLLKRNVLVFKPADLDHLSAFVLIELKHRQRPVCRKQFLLVVQVEAQKGWQERRDSALLGKIVRPEEMVAVLLAIAAGRPYVHSSGAGRRRGKNRRGAAAGPLAQSVFEPVLRAWSLNPDQFQQMRSVVRSFAKDLKSNELAVFRALVERLGSVVGGGSHGGVDE